MRCLLEQSGESLSWLSGLFVVINRVAKQMIKGEKVLSFFSMIAIILLSACQEPAPSNSPLLIQQSPLYSPMPTPAINNVHFALDVPLLQGMSYITGRGPAGIRLQVVDITEGGEVIGSGIIGDDNKFKIDLAKPLKHGRMICIELATPRDPETWLALWELRGENARAIPQMGYYFDCAITELRAPLFP